MHRTIIRRLIVLPFILIGLSLVIFLMVHMIPGDPVKFLLRDYGWIPPETENSLREELGLNLPIHEQYLRYLNKLLHGDLGRSLITNREVSSLLYWRIPNTMKLAFASLLISLAIGIPAGVISATHQNTKIDYISMMGAMLGISMPKFWLGLLLIMVLGGILHILPTHGTGGLEYLVMPAITLGTGGAAMIARLTRSSMLEVIRQDYVRTAWAKGLKERSIIYKHALRNALSPVVTYSGALLGRLLGGTVITETVFAYRGLGRLLVTAITQRDLPVIQGCAMLIAIIFVLLNMIVDIAYVFIDPRMRKRLF